MNRLLRLSLYAGIAVVLVGVHVLFLSKLIGRRSADTLDLAKWMTRITVESRRGEELDVRAASLFHRTNEKRRIVREVLEHRLTLLEAGRQFRVLHTADQEAEPDDPTTAVGAGDEAACRNVIVWVRTELSAQPEVAEQMANKLEEQLEEDLCLQE